MMVDVKGYEGLYKINEAGVIINSKGHMIRPAVSNTGYLRVALMNPGAKDKNDRTNESVHRLVAKTFLPNPNNLPVVLHKDNDPMNCSLSNLKWGTQSENIKQAFREGRKISPMKTTNVIYSYEVYNEDTGDIIQCKGRSAVAELIGYEEISLKNMIGNDRTISLGDYQGYKIRRGDRVISPIKFIN